MANTNHSEAGARHAITGHGVFRVREFREVFLLCDLSCVTCVVSLVVVWNYNTALAVLLNSLEGQGGGAVVESNLSFVDESLDLSSREIRARAL